MAFCKFTNDYLSKKTTEIENVFLKDFLPSAPPICVKVYLYGLYKCQTPEATDNTVEGFAKALDLSQEEVISAIAYWEEQNLVQSISNDPFEVRFLPIKSGSSALKKFNKDKYKKFNIAIQELITERMITPNEFQEYYYTIEHYHFEIDAMIMLIKYCVEQKGVDVGHAYILTVARNWGKLGVQTVDDVKNQLELINMSSGAVQDVMKVLGLKRSATNDEYQMFLTWKNQFEIPMDVIIVLAKKVKGAGGFLKLNALIEKCYSLKLESVKEVEDYFENLKILQETSKVVCKSLGLRYENLEVVTDEYIVPWQGLGFDSKTLELIAKYCFRSSIRTLEGMNIKINQLFKLGLLTEESINRYLEDLISKDAEIFEILERLGINRNVNATDRTFYKTWTIDWQISLELIDYAITLAIGKYLPMQYMNQILAKFHENKVKTVDEAKGLNLQKSNSSVDKNSYVQREYSNKQLNSLFDNLDEVEI